jgi:hypothetical protein
MMSAINSPAKRISSLQRGQTKKVIGPHSDGCTVAETPLVVTSLHLVQK